jgi:hypothetical protein
VLLGAVFSTVVFRAWSGLRWCVGFEDVLDTLLAQGFSGSSFQDSGLLILVFSNLLKM